MSITNKGKQPMVDPKKTSSYLPLCRKKDGGTNYVPWRRFTDDRLRLLYADVYLEFSQPANVETPDEALARLHLLYPLEPLLSETTSVVPQAVFDLLMNTKIGNQCIILLMNTKIGNQCISIL